MDNIRYQHIDTYANFENGCKQTRFTFPYGICWVRKIFPHNEYWTIVPKKFHKSTEWKGPFNSVQIMGEFVYISMYEIDHHPYFDEFKYTPQEALEILDLPNTVAIYIRNSTEIAGLARFGHFDGINGPITYIQLRKHGPAGGETFGIYTDPEGNLASPDCFGEGKWVRVDPYKADRVWNDMYRWVLNKINFVDAPCPMILNCDDAYKVWVASTRSLIEGDDPDPDFKPDAEQYLAKIKIFANQFLDISDIKSLKR